MFEISQTKRSLHCNDRSWQTYVAEILKNKMCCEKFIYLFKVKYPMLLHCFNQYPFAQNKKKKKWKHLLIHLCRFYFSYFHFFLGHNPSLSLNAHKVRPLTPLSNACVTLYVSCGTARDCLTISSIFARVSTR